MNHTGRIMRDRFGGKEPILEVIKDPSIGRTPEEQARYTLQGFVSLDGALYRTLVKNFGVEKANELHKKVWIRWVDELVNDSMKVLQIKEVKDVPTLGRLLRTVYDLLLSPLLTLEDSQKRFVGAIYADPFVEYRNIVGERVGSPYWKSLAEASQARLERIIDVVGMGDAVKADQDKCTYLGDSFTRIIVRKKMLTARKVDEK